MLIENNGEVMTLALIKRIKWIIPGVMLILLNSAAAALALPQDVRDVKPSEPPRTMQVIMLVVDGLQSDSVSAAATPNINGLAMAGIVAEDKTAALKFIEKARSFATFAEKSSDPMSKAVKELLPGIFMNHYYAPVVTLMGLLSRGAITDADVQEMQVPEAAAIVEFLIESNFGSLKNLWGSLQATITSGNPGS